MLSLNLTRLLIAIPPSVLLFLMFYTPRAHVEIKIPFLILTLLIIAISLLTGKREVPRLEVTLWTLLLMTGGALWCLYGALQSNPGFIDYLRIYVGWSALYYVLIIAIKDKSDIDNLLVICLYALIGICLFNFYMILDVAGLVPHLIDPDEPFTGMDARVGIQSGFIQITTQNIGTLFFLIPLLLSIVLLDTNTRGFNSLFLRLLLAVSFILVLLSGRRALYMVLALFPIVTLLLSRICGTAVFRRVLLRVQTFYVLMVFALICVALLLNAFTEWSATDLVDRLSGVFTDDDALRLSQGAALLSKFYESPLFGYGFGAGVSEVVRDPSHPWWYELSYHLLLHNTGLVGVLFFFSLYAYLIFRCVLIVRHNGRRADWVIHLMSGSIGFMLGNATNPYLASYDFLYAVFLLLVPINYYRQKNGAE